MVTIPCEDGHFRSFTSTIECENENYAIASYSLDPEKKYCQDCWTQIRVGERQIVERNLRLHMYVLRLMVDSRITYMQFRRLMSILDKEREWAIYAHYNEFGLYRPPNWNQADNNPPTERQIWEHEEQIREGLADAERFGVLEYFTDENQEDEDDEDAVEDQGDEDDQENEDDWEVEDERGGEEVTWAGRVNWR